MADDMVTIVADTEVRENVIPFLYGDAMPTDTSQSTLSLEGDTVIIKHLLIRDPALVDAIRRSDDPDALLRRIIEVGFRGVLSMGVGVDLSEIEQRLSRATTETTEAAELQVAQMLEDAQSAIGRILDPSLDGSVTATTLEAFASWRTEFLDRFDPDRTSSHTGRLLAGLNTLLGPGGALEARLTSALDPTSEGSGLGMVTDLIDQRFAEFRELVAGETARAEEAEKGTRKGFEFEDAVEETLRDCARHMRATVERTSTASGDLHRIVGDYVVELDSGMRIVIEAKNQKSLNLRGDGGILSEMDLALANREASVAICVSKLPDAFPKEVGPINVYGNRILVCDDGEGTLLSVALRWAEQMGSVSTSAPQTIDVAKLDHGIDRLLQLAERFKTSRRQLTQVKETVLTVHETLGDMRSELLDTANDIGREIFHDGQTVEVVDLSNVS